MQPSDDQLIAFLREQPGQSLAQICERFGVPYHHTAARHGPNGEKYGYTPEARAIRNQLQRLRRDRRLWCAGMKWEVRG